MPGNPIDDALNRRPPIDVAKRRVRVRRDVLTAIGVPADPDAPAAPWYPNGVSATAGNEVKYLIDGPETFAEIASVIGRATSTRHFIYLSAWWLSLDEPLDPKVRGSTVRELLKAAGKMGVEVRLLLYRNYTGGVGFSFTKLVKIPEQEDALALVNGLKNGFAVHDYRVPNPPVGAHHQKLLLVYGAGGLTAFCGGIDLKSDRIHGPNPPGSPGSPLHDVHCRVRGPAAFDLLQTFIERWNDHPDANYGWRRYKRVPLSGASLGRDAPESYMYVGIGKTYANGTAHPLPAPSIVSFGTKYAFAPTGLRTAEAMMLNAIAQAKDFIYIEDQYFFSDVAAASIAAALQRGVRNVTVVLTWPAYLLPLMNERRRDVLRALRAAGGDRLRVCFLKPEQGKHTYVHTKATIVDDRFVTIGSANYNRRSLTHDSEVIAGMIDAHTAGDIVWNLAHRLRVALWAEHLNMKTQAGYAEFADGVASAAHFLDPPPGSHIEPYYEDDPDQPLVTDAVQTSAAPYLGLLGLAADLGFKPAKDLENILNYFDPANNPITEYQLWEYIDPNGA